jgi:antitoxin (DNA-binding transcriptional repressor) of toxin-antitoxin stability system
LFSSSQAQTSLSELINNAILGQDVTITRDGIAVAKIIPIAPPKEKLDIETMRALTSKMKLYPGSFVEDMRATGEL